MNDRQPCQSCSAPATLFICTRCSSEMRAQLQSLAYGPKANGRTTAGLLDALEDVCLKQTKLGGGGGHRKKGDEMPIPFQPDTDRTDKAGHAILSAQGRAAHLIHAARNSLTTIMRDLCESRGIEVPEVSETAVVATWLAMNVNAIACDESAGQWRAEVDSLVRQIQRAVDRPVKIELLGFCITQVGHGTCDTPLRAPEDAIEVRCRKCRTTRRCDTVRAQGQSDARRALIPWEKVLETNKTQPEGWRIPDRKLRDWRSTGVLKPHGFLRPDGSHGNYRKSGDDVQLYKWNDIEQLRTHGVKRGDRKRARVAR